MTARLPVFAVALVLVSACQAEEQPPDPGGPTPDPKALAKCEAEGGDYAIGGLLQQYICFLPTPDAGDVCQTGDDCSGLCLAETMTCSTISPLFGCHDIVMDDGESVELCID